MDKKLIKNQLQSIVSNTLNYDVILQDDTLLYSLVGWDSITQMKVIMQVEVTYNIHFNFMDLLVWQNIVNEIVDNISKKIEK